RVLPVLARSPIAMKLAESLGAGLTRAGKSLASAELAPHLTPLFDRARSMVADVRAPEAQRITAARLLRFTSYPASGESLGALLRLSVSSPLQIAAVESLVGFHERGVTNVLIRWQDLAPQTRTRTISLLLARPADTAMLLDQVEKGVVSHN